MGVFTRSREYPNRLNEYFFAAVKAYVFQNDAAAQVAALLAAAIAAAIQRTSMIAYLRNMSADLRYAPDSDNPDEIRTYGLLSARMDLLAEQIGAKDWGISDCISLKKHLLKMDREYADGQTQGDPTVFYRRYQVLFADEISALGESDGGAFCTKCGAKIRKNWTYCGACGVRQPIEEKPQDGQSCAKCGYQMDRTRTYCMICGVLYPKRD